MRQRRTMMIRFRKTSKRLHKTIRRTVVRDMKLLHKKKKLLVKRAHKTQKQLIGAYAQHKKAAVRTSRRLQKTARLKQQITTKKIRSSVTKSQRALRHFNKRLSPVQRKNIVSVTILAGMALFLGLHMLMKN